MEKIEKLSNAAMIGDVVMVNKLLVKYSNLVNNHNQEGWTPLHLAAHYGHVETAQLLIEYGADIFAAADNKMAENFWHTVVGNQEIETIVGSFKHEVKTFMKKCKGWTPLHEAVYCGDQEMVKVLISAYLLQDDGHGSMEN